MRSHNLARLLVPHRRYNVFSGTATWPEWSKTIRSYFRRNDGEDEAQIRAYEKEFGRITNTAHTFGFAAARMGLYAILEALDIGPGDEVIIPAFTCVVVANAILYRGAKPVYVDIDPTTFNIDVSKVEAAITSRTRALYAQHTFGLVCDVDGLNAIGRERGLPIIEDAALALGAEHNGRPVGFLTDVAFFSSDYSKVINTQLGGMVTTNNADIAKRLETLYESTPSLPQSQIRKMARTFIIQYPLLRPNTYWLGRSLFWLAHRMGLFFSFQDELSLEKPTEYPYPAKLSAFQSRLGLSQLARLEINLAHRRMIGLALEERVSWLGTILKPDATNHIFLRYSFLVKNRDAFVERFRKHFDLSIWFTSVVHGRCNGFEKVGYRAGSCPIAEYVAQHIVNLPTHSLIDPSFLLARVDEQRDFISENLIKSDCYAAA